MRVIRVSERYELGALGPQEAPDPGPPLAGQVQLRLKAVGVNYRDLLVVTGTDRWRPPVGRVPCSDGAGIIVQLGEHVDRFRVGDLALTTILPNWISGPLTAAKREGGLGGPAADGCLCELINIDAEALVHAPSHLTAVEAATLPTAGVTAWHVLTRAAALRDGASVLIGGTGGVSLFVLQLALAAGARAIVTSSSDAKLARASAMGAFGTVNYRERSDDWAEEVLALTGGHGVDLAVDIGGASSLDGSIRATGMNGTVAVVGLVGGLKATINLAEVFQKNLRLDGVETGSRAMLEDMIAWLEPRGIRPVVDRVFALSEAPLAFEHLRSAAPFGKVCIEL